MESDPRIQLLARRVRVLERYRHTVAVAVAGIVVVFGMIALPDFLGADWPRFCARLMAATAGIVLAVLIDICFAVFLAVWETQHDRLVRERGLPRAELVRRR